MINTPHPHKRDGNGGISGTIRVVVVGDLSGQYLSALRAQTL
jgi:hypothetical protein